MKHTRIWAIILLGWTIQLTAQPTVINTLADSGPGSLRLAIFNSSPGDTIVMSPSLIANGSDTLYFSSYIFIPRSLTIIGAMNSTDTLFFSGNNATRLFEVIRTGLSPIDVHFRQVAVVEAYYNHNQNTTLVAGSAIQLNGPVNCTLNKCLFKDNLGINGAWGAAICSLNSTVQADSCQFKGNSVTLIDPFSTSRRGGSIYSGQSQLVFTYCHFTGNTAEAGSAVYSYQSTVSYDHCLIAYNNQASGGAITAWQDLSCTIKNSQIIDNIDKSLYIFNCNISNIESNLILISNSSLSSENYFSSKRNFIRNNAFTSFKMTSIYGTFGDTLVIRNNSFLWAKNVAFDPNPSFSIEHNGYFNLSASLVDVSNNTFLSPGPSLTIPAVSLRVPVGFNPILRNNIFFTEPNKRSLTIYEGPLGGVWLPSASDGHNIFSDNNFHAGTNDLTLIDSVQLALEPLGYYGGITPTRIPKPNSVALNSGNPNNFSPAQNGPIYGVRDRGAAERPVITNDTVSACFGPVTWWGNTFTNPGVYRDTASNANSLDSTGVLVLTGLEAALVNNGGLLTAAANEPSIFQWINCNTGQVVNTGATFLPAANGSYAAVATAGSCVDTTECVAYNEVSLDENRAQSVVVYPNPTSGTIRILSRHGELPTSYRISDLQGRLLGQGPLVEPTLNFQGLPLGTYLLHFTWKDGSQAVERILIAP
jgi:hypothetical protein